MVRRLTAALIGCVAMGSIAQAQVDAQWTLESAARCRMSTTVGALPDRYTVILQTDFNAPALLKVAVLGGDAAGAKFALESPAGRWPVNHETPASGAAANKFKADIAAGADWALRKTTKQRTIGFALHAGNAARAVGAFDACVAAIAQRRAAAPLDAMRPAELTAGLGPDVCVLSARYEHGDDRVSLKLVDVPDTPQMIATGFVRTTEDRVGIVELGPLGGSNVTLDDLQARNDVADSIILRTKLLAGDILKVPVRFTTGETWTLALGGADEATTIAVFDDCVRARSKPKP